MIAYLKDRDVTIDVPDDISEGDLADIQKNFENYVEPQDLAPSKPATQPAAGGSDPSPAAPAGAAEKTLKSWKPSFYHAHVEPILQELGLADIPLVQNRTPSAYAFVGKAAEQLTFGAVKPITEDVFGQAYKDHPVWSFAGDVAGGVGSLMATGGVLKLAGLEAQAARAAGASAKVAAAGPRFVAPAIMTAATFGTHTFVTKTVEALEKGGVDIADFGASVVKDTVLGGLLGGISGVASARYAIGSAGGLGYLSARMEGADEKESALNGAIWAIFEAVGSYGRDERLRRQALKTLSESIGDYVGARTGMDPAAAARVGEAIVTREAAKVGGVEAIVKSEKEGALNFIEGLNQKIRNSKVETTTTAGEAGARPPIRIEGPAPAAATTEPPAFKNTGDALRWGAGLGEADREAAVKALDARVASRQPAVDEAMKKGDFQAGMNLAVQNQFDREAKETILGQTNPDALKSAGVKPPADEGQTFAAKTGPQTPAFKKWFGDSKVVDDAGQPIRAFHGTTKAFTKFNTDRQRADANNPAWSGDIGTFFTTPSKHKGNYDPGNAEYQAGSYTEGGGPDAVGNDYESHRPGANVVPVYLSIKNPKEFDGFEDFQDQRGNPAKKTGQEYKKELIAEGYDGIVIRNSMTDGDVDRDDWIAFFPEQIKSATGNRGTYDQEDPNIFADKTYASNRPGRRNFGGDQDRVAPLTKAMGGIDKIQKLQTPELVKLSRALTGEVPLVRRLVRGLLGQFKAAGEGEIKVSEELAQNPDLMDAVLAHEIGHLMDFKDEGTMARGNILGRLASLREYRKSLLPESASSPDPILTDTDRARLRAEAEKMARAADAKATPEKGNQFDPEAVLNVWNRVEGQADPALVEYIKRLSADQKKSIIRAAMEARKKGEKLTIADVQQFNKDAAADPANVAEIYRELLQAEIKKRRLFQEEVISAEMKKLTQFWKPFDDTADAAFTRYRYSSPELYADFVSVLLNAPAKAKEIAPFSYEAFFNYLEAKPEVMKNLLELQALIQSDDADLQKVRGEDILAMYQRGEEAFRARQLSLEAAKKSTWKKLQLIFWDKNQALLDERNKLAKREAIAPADDAQYAIEQNALMAGVVRSYLASFDKDVYFAAKEADLLEDVKTILFLDRVGGDREELANPLGHTPETAQAFLDNMKKTDPARYQAAADLAQKARTWFRDVSQIPGAEDFWTPQQIFTMGENDRYAPFRVVDYMKDYVSAGFSQQMGTFKDIGDPLTSLAMKGVSVIMAVERNRLKKIVGQMLLRSGTEMKAVEIKGAEPGKFNIPEPSDRHLGTLAWKDGGKWVAYHLDRDIADTFNTVASEKIGMIGGTINHALGNPFFRATYITFNPTFQAVNLIRDFFRTWKTTPGLTLGRAFRLYLESVPEARARAKGAFDPLIQEMERAGALQITLNDFVAGKTTEDKELDALVEKYGITAMVKGKDGVWRLAEKYQGIPVVDQARQILDTLRFVGDTIETLPKVVGWKALDYMATEERAYFVRNLVGTPNPKRAGVASPISNGVLMFSNIFKEAFRGLIESAFTNEKVRGGYWKKTLSFNLSLRVAMGMAAAGFFGAGVKAVMDKASEYHKANYIVVPLGIDQEGNGVYLTLPQDEDARLMGAIFWKALNHEGNLISNLSDVLSFGSENFPGVSPALLIGGAWLKFLSGGNPHDTFRDQDILTDQERAAGGLRAFEPMARWTANETGLTRLDIRDRLRDEPIHKTLVSSLPIIQRFVRVGRTGEYQDAKAAGEKVRKDRARQSLDMKEAAAKAIKEGVSLTDFLKAGKTAEEIDARQSIYNAVSKKMSDDPIVQALTSAQSNDEKAAILKKAGEGKDKKEFENYLAELYSNRIISARVYVDARGQA